MANRTFTIIKPDSVRKGNFGRIISRIEAEGFRILGIKKVHLSGRQAQAFYAVHRERPFFPSLVEYMTSGPVYVAALERDDAVPHLRKIMGVDAWQGFPNADHVHFFGFYIGNYPTLDRDRILRLCELLNHV